MKNSNKNEKNTFYPKVLFTTGLPRTFRASNIAHLYEVAQVYPVVLLSEELDSETEKILRNKKLFPKLEKIIPYRQFTGPKASLFSPFKNYYYYKLAKNVIKQYKPDILIMGEGYLFQLYLSRFAKQQKSTLHISIQGGISGKINEVKLWSLLLSTYLKTPPFLPLRIRTFITRCKRYLAHFFYYWILPLTVGQLPFLGNTSIFLQKGEEGLRYCDYALLYPKRDINLFMETRVPLEKLYILPHPFKKENTRKFLEKIYFSSATPIKKDKKVVTIILPDVEVGFRRKDYSLISKGERIKKGKEIISLISQILEGWKIYIKPHPSIKTNEELKKIFEPILEKITVVESQEPVDKYIKISDLIIGFSPQSTSLFTASLYLVQKIILSLDFFNELLGDVYKDFEGIEYISEKDKFIQTLECIRDGKFKKKICKKESKMEEREFSATCQVLEHLYKKFLEK